MMRRSILPCVVLVMGAALAAGCATTPREPPVFRQSPAAPPPVLPQTASDQERLSKEGLCVTISYYVKKLATSRDDGVSYAAMLEATESARHDAYPLVYEAFKEVVRYVYSRPDVPPLRLSALYLEECLSLIHSRRP